MYLKTKTYPVFIAGMGPTAWNRDLRILKMYTPHHPEHHEDQRSTAQIRRAEVRVK